MKISTVTLTMTKELKGVSVVGFVFEQRGTDLCDRSVSETIHFKVITTVSGCV